MAQISEQVISQIQDSLNIVEVVSGYIPLKQAGRNFKAHCPFHHEKTPSFLVSPDKQIYHCFGCGAGGDVISFVMKYEKLEFPEAVETLAKRAGIYIERFEKNAATDASSSLKAQLYKINELAANFYTGILKNERLSHKALHYLKERRLNEDIISSFRIGYAPEGWDSFINFAKSKGIQLDLLEKAGLVVPGKHNSFYDRFRDRIIFPIFNVQGKVEGFGARVLNDDLPKYINSPDTLIYHKSKNLYGLAQSKDYIRTEDYAVIVEGYVDLLTPYQNGIRNLVASLGTALTTEQARLLKRYTHNAVIIYDADEAGEMAALRGLDILVEEGMDVKIVSLPKGYDPDSYVRKHGAAEFLEHIKKAKTLFDYKLEVLLSKYSLRVIEDKAKIAVQMLLTIKKINNEVLKSSYIRKLAAILSVSEESLLKEIKKIKGSYEENTAPAAVQTASSAEVSPAEKILLTLMLEDATARLEILERINIDDFEHAAVNKIIKIIAKLATREDELTPAKVFFGIDDENTKKIFSEIMAQEHGISDVRKNIDDCLKSIRHRNIGKRCQLLHEEIYKAEKSKDHGQLEILLKEYNTLLKERCA